MNQQDAAFIHLDPQGLALPPKGWPFQHLVEIWTDHNNLQYFKKPQKLNRQQARWVPELADYDYMLHHKPGKSNKADPLSR